MANLFFSSFNIDMDLRINNLYQNRYTPQPSFKSSLRTVTNADGSILWRNTTNFFREDLPWIEMVDYFAEKYANIKKVRVLCYGCSDGSEPLSLAMLLINRLGKQADKFFPIIAKDIDPEIIKKANSGNVEINHKDKASIEFLLKEDLSKYFETSTISPYVDSITTKIKPILTDVINFSVADIKDEVHTIPQENTIVFARNFWPYIKNQKDVRNLAQDLRERLENNCNLVVGDFDTFAGIRAELLLARFKKTPISGNIYEPDPRYSEKFDCLFNRKM